MEPLPSKEQILDACRTAPENGHPVLESTYLLAGLHIRRLRCAAGTTEPIDRHRARLVIAIDRWVATELPPAHGGAYLHTETIGSVIDRIAQFSAGAYDALENAAPATVHSAWQRLAELAVGYQDLAAEVATGIRRLPDLTGGGHDSAG